MAKKKVPKTSSDGPDSENNGVSTPKNSRNEADDRTDRSPEVEAAAEAVRRAEAELERAKRAYEDIRRQAVDRLRRIREKKVADLIDDGLKLVKRFPGPSVVVAVLIGFFLGRLFRR